MIEFLSVEWLWALWAIPALVLVTVWADRARRRRRDALLGAGAERLADRIEGRAAGRVLLLAGLVAAVLGLARPTWGVEYEEVRSRGTDLIVLLDASRSMLARDATPDRLSRAKFALGRLFDLIEERGGHRVGLIAFAGTTSVQSPLTLDLAYVRDRLEQVSPERMPRGGTVIGDAIRTAVKQLTERATPDSEARILLLTDGEDHESFPIEAAEEAAAAGIPVHSVGIGDPSSGGRIPLADGEFVTFRGETVVSRLDESTLLEVARISRGSYVPAGTRSIPLDRIYAEVLAGDEGALRDVRTESRRIERHGWFVALALLLAIGSRFASRTVTVNPEEAA